MVRDNPASPHDFYSPSTSAKRRKSSFKAGVETKLVMFPICHLFYDYQFFEH